MGKFLHSAVSLMSDIFYTRASPNLQTLDNFTDEGSEIQIYASHLAEPLIELTLQHMCTRYKMLKMLGDVNNK